MKKRYIRAFYNRNKKTFTNTFVMTVLLSTIFFLLAIAMTQGYAECAKGIAC